VEIHRNSSWDHCRRSALRHILNDPIETKYPDEGGREMENAEWGAQAVQIGFEHVWFAYKDDDYVGVKDLNFYHSSQ